VSNYLDLRHCASLCINSCGECVSEETTGERRVVRRLRRLAVLGLKPGDADQQRFVLRRQLIDAHREPAVLPQKLQHQRLLS
jgi:hypothetical protein